MAESQICIVYQSRSLLPTDGISARNALSDLVSQARRNNERDAITGALLVFGDRIVQVLEGDRHAVLDAFSRITADRRHRDVTVLHFGRMPARRFASWNLAFAWPIADRLADDVRPTLGYGDAVTILLDLMLWSRRAEADGPPRYG